MSQSSPQRRFTAVYFALAAIAGAAVSVFLVLAFSDSGGGSSTSAAASAPASWSSWRPAGQNLASVQQIANHVSGEYRLSDKQQLVAVSGALPGVSGRLVSGSAATAAARVQIVSFAVPVSSTGQYAVTSPLAVEYQMCGLGPACAIPGAPSVKRGILLQREALELALYSLEYLPIDAVVVLYPPAADGQRYALYFQRTDLQHELDRPLSQTLAASGELKPGQLTRTDVQTVHQLVMPRVYGYRYTLQQDGYAQMVLTRPQVAGGG